ncbi:predicted protein [Postia placenta Mad-698-R]|nr:predicted protein [Postia placenta Mad-698-R]
MATATILHAATHTVVSAQAQPNSPPIVALLRVVSSWSTIVLSSVLRAVASLARAGAIPLSALAIALYYALLYVLAPAIVFCDIVLDVFVRTPYAIVTSVLANVYPLYVFVGASCICAACIGLAARMCTNVVKSALFPPTRPAGPAPAKMRKRSMNNTFGATNRVHTWQPLHSTAGPQAYSDDPSVPTPWSTSPPVVAGVERISRSAMSKIKDIDIRNYWFESNGLAALSAWVTALPMDVFVHRVVGQGPHLWIRSREGTATGWFGDRDPANLTIPGGGRKAKSHITDESKMKALKGLQIGDP